MPRSPAPAAIAPADVHDSDARAAEILERMTLREKVGQMTQVEKGSIAPFEVAEHAIGSVLSGGGGNPSPNDPRRWREMVLDYQRAALRSRLGVPLLYGVDAVHGHSNVVGATIFPHNIGLGAAADPALMRRIGRITALEAVATGARWSFGPAVSVPQDLRWGRSFEGYGQDPELVSRLAAALIDGYRGDGWDAPTAVLPSVKHFLADGGAAWGTSQRLGPEAGEQDRTLASAGLPDAVFGRLVELGAWRIDQGDSRIDEATLRRVHLAPYRAAIAAGALNVMASFSSWNGVKMHAHPYLLTTVLKGEIGFEGFVVSDWEAVDQLSDDHAEAVALAIGAGLDMVMVPYRYRRFIDTLVALVEGGTVPEARIDDAVLRILRVKGRLGLFERPGAQVDEALLARVGSPEHRAVAREAVQRSLVLLKDEGVLPLDPATPSLLVVGEGADDIGLQCGGWTIEWLGAPGPITEGTTILDGIRAMVAPDCDLVYAPDGAFDGRADVGIAVLAEEPYAEGMGDRADLHLTVEQRALLDRVRARCHRLLVILLSGRPLIVTEEIDRWDAFVAAWLPGSEGAAIAETLFGGHPFHGRLSVAWPRSMAQIPLDDENLGEHLFEIGAGLGA